LTTNDFAACCDEGKVSIVGVANPEGSGTPLSIARGGYALFLCPQFLWIGAEFERQAEHPAAASG
jgi:hypothetical protein